MKKAEELGLEILEEAADLPTEAAEEAEAENENTEEESGGTVFDGTEETETAEEAASDSAEETAEEAASDSAEEEAGEDAFEETDTGEADPAAFTGTGSPEPGAGDAGIAGGGTSGIPGAPGAFGTTGPGAPAGNKEKKGRAKKQKRVRTPEQKRRRRKIVRRVILAAAVLLAIGYFVTRAQQNAALPMQVETMAAEKGDMDQTVSLSGTVESAETKVYYASVSAVVETVNVEAGDPVKRGDLLVGYRESDLTQAKRELELDLKSAQGSYNDAIQRANDAIVRYGFQGMTKTDFEAVIDQIEVMVADIEEKIREKSYRIALVGQELTLTQMDPDQNREPGDQSEDEEMQLAIQEELSKNSFALQYDEEIQGWNRNIKELNALKAKLEEANAAQLSGGNMQQLAANRELAELRAGNSIEDLTTAAEGISADFNGVVTELHANEGMTSTPGGALLTVASTEDVIVSTTLTKYDLEKVREGQSAEVVIAGKNYRGKVEKISRTATKNDRGGTVVRTEIAILNPDSDVFLGVEADITIRTASKKNVLRVPVEAVNTDTKGLFVYILENGLIARRDVESGIVSDEYQEVTSGLNEGDLILTEITAEVAEGVAAVSMDETGAETEEE